MSGYRLFLLRCVEENVVGKRETVHACFDTKRLTFKLIFVLSSACKWRVGIGAVVLDANGGGLHR